ncbi:hypothetical protein K0M31_016835 [Melipona bicolor]|uniref:Uncharacterized protein n=1 Tax=Melipona bicolor TaxID=60889 RepID=A0AA40FE38_9HYME|nr:hypothetical protein K0M31_016835 [Melipona bicolor]
MDKKKKGWERLIQTVDNAAKVHAREGEFGGSEKFAKRRAIRPTGDDCGLWPLHEILMESLIQSSLKSLGQYLSTLVG